MLEIRIPGRDAIRAERLLLDVNGTLTIDGALLAGVAERVEKLGEVVRVTLLTADTLGTAAEIAAKLNAELVTVDHDGGAHKLRLVQEWDPRSVIAIGNGANDALMLEAAALGIVVVQPEGAALSALRGADVAFTSVCDALDALLFPKRLVATLRV